MFYVLSVLSIFLWANQLVLGEETASRIKKSIYTRPRYNYTMPIKYYDEGDNNLIEEELALLSRLTCITFKKTNEEMKNRGIIFKLFDFDVIEDNLDKDKPTIVKLSGNCYEDSGCLKHMIALALGLIPHHNRWDRDKYFEFKKSRISPNFKMSFDKVKGYRTRIYNTALDYGSISNYDPITTSSNGKYTYYPLVRNVRSFYYFMLGQRFNYSHSDIKVLNDFYCGKVCSKKVRNCHHGSYQDPKKCDRCRCPSGYRGKRCQFTAYSDEGCPKRYHVSGKEFQDIEARGKRKCYFFIQGTPYGIVDIKVDDMNITWTSDKCFEGLGLEIKNRHDKGATGLSLCGRKQFAKIDGVFSQVLVIYNGHSDTDYVKFKHRDLSQNEASDNNYLY